MNNSLKEQLRNAGSVEEVKDLVKGCADLEAEQIYQEIERHRSDKAEKLDIEELEAVSGGADRDWKKSGCAATCEYNSWCGSNDFCYCFDVTYDNFFVCCPDGHDHVYENNECVRCGYLRPNGRAGIPR